MIELVLVVGLPWLMVRCARALHQGYLNADERASHQRKEVAS